MNAEQQERLAAFAAFERAAKALREIRDRRLYLKTHDTFEAYCVERWGFPAGFGEEVLK
jgi:hypothetical protein